MDIEIKIEEGQECQKKENKSELKKTFSVIDGREIKIEAEKTDNCENN